jgi:hypothetical protein
MNTPKPQVLADVLQGLFACIFGGITFYVLHDLWFDNWQGRLADPPMANPAYGFLSTFFVSLPFAAGALVIGLIAGSGQARPWWGGLTRLLAGPILSLPVLSLERAEYTHWYVPILFGSFLIAYLVSAIYSHITSA